MTEALALRPYQTEAIDALETAWANGMHRAAVVLPTGAGKTVVFSHLAARLHERGIRTLVIAHRDELINQAVNKIRDVAPHLKVGVVKAGRDEHAGVDIVVASVQTLAVERRRKAIGNVGLVIVDEAHHAAAPTYMSVLDHFGCFSGIPAAGFTATMSRTDGGLADVWQDVVYTLDILPMIRGGYLVDVRGKTVVVQGLALDQVQSRGGDFQEGQLGQALTDSGAAQAVADAYLKFAADRPGVIFTPTVETAHQMSAVMNAAGIPTASVWGEMPREERELTLKRYRTREIQVLSNCMVLTEGFDAPWASCCVVARPTRSTPLYVQMVGRVLRTFPGKSDALVLDVVGISGRHKLASIVDLTEAKLKQIGEDESLTELAERTETAHGGRRLQVAGWQDFSLFEESTVAWLNTTRGTWFIPVPDRNYFLVPGAEPETYRVRCHDARGRGGDILTPPDDRDMSMSFAMSVAEKYAQRHAGRIAARDAKWRTQPATPAQVGACKKMRIRVPAGATKGEVNNLIAVHIASRAIDPFVLRSGEAWAA